MNDRDAFGQNYRNQIEAEQADRNQSYLEGLTHADPENAAETYSEFRTDDDGGIQKEAALPEKGEADVGTTDDIVDNARGSEHAHDANPSVPGLEERNNPNSHSLPLIGRGGSTLDPNSPDAIDLTSGITVSQALEETAVQATEGRNSGQLMLHKDNEQRPDDDVERYFDDRREEAKKKGPVLEAIIDTGIYIDETTYGHEFHEDEAAIQSWNSVARTVNEAAKFIDDVTRPIFRISLAEQSVSDIYGFMAKLAGVTGYEKTQERLKYLSAGRDVLPLIPEIANTPSEKQVLFLTGILSEVYGLRKTLINTHKRSVKNRTKAGRNQIDSAMEILLDQPVAMKELRRLTLQYAPEFYDMLVNTEESIENLVEQTVTKKALVDAKNAQAIAEIAVHLISVIREDSAVEDAVHILYSRSARRRFNPEGLLGEPMDNLVMRTNKGADVTPTLELDFGLLVGAHTSVFDAALLEARNLSSDSEHIFSRIMEVHDRHSRNEQHILGRLANSDDWRGHLALMERQEELARRLGVSLSTLRNSNRFWDFEYHTINGAVALLNSIDRQISSLAAGMSTDDDARAFALRRAMAVHAAFQAYLLGDRIEASRLFKGFFINQSDDGQSRTTMSMMISQTGGAKLARQMASDLWRLRDPGKRARYIKDTVQATSLGQVEQAFGFALNMQVDALALRPIDHAERVGSLIIDVPQSYGERSHAAVQGVITLRSALFGFRDFIKTTFFDGPGNLSGFWRVPWGSVGPKVVKAENWFGTIYRALQAHNIGSVPKLELALYAGGTKAGLLAEASKWYGYRGQPTEKHDKLHDFLLNPPQEVMADARDNGLSFLLVSNEDLIDAFKQSGLGGLGVSAMLPVFEAALRRSKGAAVSQVQPSSLDEVDQGFRALSALAVATTLMLMEDGLVSGAPPQDTFGKDRWRQKKKTSYAVRIGGQWVPFENLGPVGRVMRHVVRFAEMSAQIDPAKRDQYAARLVDTFSGLFESKNGVLALGRIASAAWDGVETRIGVDESSGGPVRAFASSMVELVPPNPRFDADLAGLGKIETDIAEAWEDQRMAVNMLGDEVLLPPGVSAQQMPGFYTHKTARSKLYQELRRLDVWVPMPVFYVDDVELTSEEYKRLMKRWVGPRIKKRLLGVLADPRYRDPDMTDQERRDWLINEITDKRAQAVHEFDADFRAQRREVQSEAMSAATEYSPNAAHGEKLLATLSQQFGQS